MAAPSAATDTGIISLIDLIDFVAHVAECYPEITKDFPQELIEMISLHHAVLSPDLREKIVGSLVLLKRKDIIDSSTTIQTVLFNLVVADRSSSKALWSVKITRELWKRQIWTESKAVEIMKEAALADNEKVIIGGVRFFLGGDKEREELEDESSDDDVIDVGKVKHQATINKGSKKRAKAIEKAKAIVKKKEKKKNAPHPLNFSALHLLHDPQGFAENLFQKHLQNTKAKLNLEQRLLVLQLVSRLVGLHKLTIIQLYSYFLKYLTPKQPSVTSFLASLAQSCHSLVPPDTLEPLIQKIANEFVSEGSAAEVASAGLNAIREICVRQPLAMNDTLLQDLVMYRKSKDKGVMMAAKGLLSLYREVGAEKLKRRDRGKDAAMGLKVGERKSQRYGEEEIGGIEGLELLEKWKEEERRKNRRENGLPSDGESDEDEENENDWAAWNMEEDDSDDSGGWIDVQSDVDIVFSDSEDDEPTAKKAKTDEDATKAGDDKKTEESEAKKISRLATTRILTPADLAKLAELRAAASVNALLPENKRKRLLQQAAANRHADDPLTAAEIEGLAALSAGKQTREEKIAHVNETKTDRSEFKSKLARKKETKEKLGKSSTNKEKARKKNFMMTLGKAKAKGKRSLVETRATLRAHHERNKRGGKRGNQG
ncbi:uncharacterized protein ARB_01870 [Trichophyton benhamiae CBS 112371]|uniref:Protein SDA1 n=1 Tax=Arthroderma benhamiae (strain ATCC MYA-4681 / CBS 112371) TaxID=663331 RepID=D4B098_ARTBC|nr:uncharacterized protein ARB_01870 [Trichophyton benhamiae CBS 112371]EFE31250.1 hypothetical protein ARB_01870 [Trichophyton benhamiae CBS 112371]